MAVGGGEGMVSRSKDSQKLESSLLKSELSQGVALAWLSFNTVLEEEENTNHKLNKWNNTRKEENKNLFLNHNYTPGISKEI